MMKRLLAILAVGCATNAGAFPLYTPYPLVEYVNEATGHYQMVPHGSSALEAGGEDGQWVRTGYALTMFEGVVSGFPVCHFYNPVHGTHYYTVQFAECNLLRQRGSGWDYQGEAFKAYFPEGGACPRPFIAVRRLWDGLASFRFSADPAIVEKMLSRGWTDEGIGFCAYGAVLAPVVFDAGNFEQKTLAECEARVGPCIASEHIVPLTRRIPSYLPPLYIQPNDAYPSVLKDLIGLSGWDLYTSRDGGPGDVTQHSFSLITGGVYLVGSDRDRASGPYASLSPMYQLQGGVGPITDERAFPWRNGREQTLVISSTISVSTFTRVDGSGDAYGLQLIHFADRVSGRRFYVTLQAFGVSPGGDYIGADYSTGRAIVSTSYRENPLFGRRIAGNVTRCNVAEDCLPRTVFTFQLSKADFQAVLGYARMVDPLLTTDPANYFVSSFHQHNETYLDATIGMATFQLTLQIWPRLQ